MIKYKIVHYLKGHINKDLIKNLDLIKMKNIP